MSDILKEIADNLGAGLVNGSYLNGIADYYGVDTTISTDIMADILTAIGGNPATSTDYLQDIVLELGGTVTINGNWMEAWEAITAVATAPVNTVAPVVSGSPSVGDVLTTTDGTWSGTPTSYSYQWKRGATNIGTNANTYTLVSADANTNITCVVTATNATGSTNATSNVFVPSSLSAPENLSLPAIDAFTTWQVGMTIGFTGNEWSGNPVPTLTYQWQRTGGNISGATDDTYDLTGDDEGYLVGVKCTATNSQGTDFVLSNTVLIDP